jgi:hypothetical protein
MAFQGEPARPGPEANGIAVLVLETSNEISDFEPRVTSVEVLDRAEEPTRNHFYVDDSVIVGDPGGEEEGTSGGRILHYVSMSLPPGEHTLNRIVGIGLDLRQSARPFFRRGAVHAGNFRFHLGSSFSVRGGRVCYIGRIRANLRRRTAESESRAGAAEPAADQMASGFYIGTFDLKIADAFDADMAGFRKRCPEIGRYYVDRNVMTVGR